VLERAVTQRAFPAVSIEVGTATQILWCDALGRLTYDADSPPASADTLFDLASLTKVLATTPVIMQLVERGTLGLDDPVARHVQAWRSAERASVTLRDLLAHCSGLPPWRPYFRGLHGRADFERAITSEPLDYMPRSMAVYSDLGFMLLGFVLEDGVGLAHRFTGLLAQMGVAEEMQFNPPVLWHPRIAPTEDDPWRGRRLVGEVHDENAWALGGVAGHAGLFGTVGAVGACARHALQVLGGRTGVVGRSTMEMCVTRDVRVPGSSRALGWDTMLPTSSCGTRMSRRSFGHTGYTGTSLWIDPDQGVYVALLTNRVHPTRDNERIRVVRPALHDAVFDALA
jgi:CubicO group peptidase (beta-lactamase class C family)